MSTNIAKKNTNSTHKKQFTLTLNQDQPNKKIPLLTNNIPKLHTSQKPTITLNTQKSPSCSWGKNLKLQYHFFYQIPKSFKLTKWLAVQNPIR